MKQSVRRLATGCMAEVSELQARYSSLLHVIQTGSGAHTASYPMSNGSTAPSPGREADHSPQTSGEVKNTRIYTSTPPYTFTA
jgi:hypothetical protein